MFAFNLSLLQLFVQSFYVRCNEFEMKPLQPHPDLFVFNSEGYWGGGGRGRGTDCSVDQSKLSATQNNADKFTSRTVVTMITKQRLLDRVQ